LESYWESWHIEDFPNDFASFLESVPATPIGSCDGVNYVTIAFGDFSGGFSGIGPQNNPSTNFSYVIDGIKSVHAKGGKVKMAYGGAMYDMSGHIHSNEDADGFVASVKALKDKHGLDGVDLDIESGGASASLQMHLIQSLREQCGEDFHITFTIPALTYSVEPWKTVITEASQFMDGINIMSYDYYWAGYNYTMDIQGLMELGVPKSKIVLGLMPGHHDAGNEYTSIEDAVEATRDAKQQGLGGMMTWDINRDTDKRMDYPQGQDNLYQTGKSKAAFINAISKAINC